MSPHEVLPTHPRPVKSTNVRAIQRAPAFERLRTHPLNRGLRQLARVSPGLAGSLAHRTFFITPPRQRARPEELAALGRGCRAVVATRAGNVVTTRFGRGPTVLLVHGWGGRATQMLAFVEPLAAAGFASLLVDLPAHGESPGWRTTLPACADALVDVLAAHGAHAVVAHSFGAATVGLALIRGLAVNRVVLIAAASEPGAYFRGWVGGVIGEGERFEAISKVVESQLGVPFDEVAGAKLARRQHLPALVVHDREDRETPFSGAEAIAANWAGAEFLGTSGLGHFRVLRDPDVLSRVTNFIAADSRRCAQPGCGRPIASAHAAERCTTCTLEQELANPESRRVRGR